MFFIKSTRFLVKSLIKNLFFNALCSCESFLLIFLLLYVFFESAWIIIFIVLSILAKLYNLQDMFLYHPTEPAESRIFVEQPSNYELPYEIVNLVTIDRINLHSYFIKQKPPLLNSAPTIIMFHGNAGNIGQRVLLAKYIYNYCECNVLLVEYRGYGLSEGTPSENGFYKDAEAACKYLSSRDDIDKNKIVLYGQSIGGAVAINTAVNYKFDFYGLIVENTFTTLPDIARELFSSIPGVNFIPDFCIKNQYRNLDKVKQLKMPCLLIGGQVDTLVPPRMMIKLFEKCNSPYKRLLKIQQGDHNNTWAMPGYFQGINKFLLEVSMFRKQANMQDVQVWNVD